jgi:hypothetical protein
MNGAIMFHLGGNLFTQIMATPRSEMICSVEIMSAMISSF